jgi:hypothetical protein
MSIILVFDYTGAKLYELEANVRRSWALNQEGDAEFALSLYDPKMREDLIRFGNWIVVRDNRLPDWVGMIEPDRTWSVGMVGVTAYSAERIFRYRRIVDDKKKGGPGELAKWALGHVNAGGISLGFGAVDNSGEALEEPVGETTVADFISGLISKTKYELMVEPVLNGNNLSLTASWSKKLGWDTGLLLSEGVHFKAEQSVLVEQGEIYNDLFGISNAATSQNRKTSTARNAESARVYGPRSGVVSFDNSEAGSVETLTRTAVAKAAWPRRTVALNLINVASHMAQCRVGNVVTVEFFSLGFTGAAAGCRFRARILGAEFDDAAQTLRIAADEVRDDA